MAETIKDTIYIDVDDEITTVIDRVRGSNKKLVALVLPKRSSVFQSIVNMKLLKRKSEEAKKDIVLVTSDSTVLPLAGAVGLYVAKTLSSKPEIPPAPVMNQNMVEADEDEVASLDDEPEEVPEEDDALKEVAAAAAVGVGAAAVAKEAKKKNAEKQLDDTIELDNLDSEDGKPTDTAMPAAAVATANAKKKSKEKKDKNLKVPNFERFRLIAIISGIALVVLIILGIFMFKVWPQATINVQTNAQNVDANVSFNMSTSATKLNTSTNTIPSKEVTETKTYTATVNATGTQNNGQKATGTITVTGGACSSTYPSDIPVGYGISSNSLTFITQSSITFTTGKGPHNTCEFVGTTSSGSTNIPISAQSGGSNYNLSNAPFSFPGTGGAVTGNGSTSGGTDDNVTVVSQADITSAESKIATNDSGAKTDLTNQLNTSNFYPIPATFSAGAPATTTNASAGTAANSVTATQTVKYTMYGVNQQDLNQLLNSAILGQTGSGQNIIDNGLSQASYNVGSTPTQVTMTTTAIVGPNINTNQIKAQVAGKKEADIISTVKADQDVSNVTVKFSPFYVSSAPTNTAKIKVNIAKPTNNPNATN